jgi:hypothetical protein
MSMLKSETVKAWAREAQDLEVTSERADAIAKLIEPVAEFARQGSKSIRFDNEPGDFLRALQRWSGVRK